MQFITDYASWVWHDKSVDFPDKAVLAGKVLLVFLAVYYLAVFLILGLTIIFAPFEFD